MSEPMTLLDTMQEPAQASMLEKKSEFIGQACHVESLDQTLDFVNQLRVAHPKAKHVAYAAIFNDSSGHGSERMSDDGEPSGSAGKPILELMRMRGITDCALAVIRYFGGILLGSGSLTRAYSNTASLTLRAARLARIVAYQQFEVGLEYPQLGTFHHLLASYRGRQVSETYGDHVVLRVLLPLSGCERFQSQILDAFSAKVKPQEIARISLPEGSI